MISSLVSKSEEIRAEVSGSAFSKSEGSVKRVQSTAKTWGICFDGSGLT